MRRKSLYYIAKPRARVYHLMIASTKTDGNPLLCGRYAEAGMSWWKDTPRYMPHRCKSCTRALARLALLASRAKLSRASR